MITIRIRRMIAIFLTVVMLTAALCIIPHAVSAEAVSASTIANPSAALATSPVMIDGVVDEFWETVPTTLTMTAWANRTDDTQYTTEVIDTYAADDLEGFGVSHTVKIANDSEYVYVLYETTTAGDSVGFQIGFNSATGTTGEVGEWIWFMMKQDVQNGSANTATVRHFRSSYSNNYTDKDPVWHGVVAGNTYTTKETGAGIFEVRLPIPESVKGQLQEGNVDITFTGNTYTKRSVTGESRPAGADWTCGFVLPGFSTNGTDYPHGETPATVTLQRASRVICGNVENVLGKTVEIDGMMNASEGWSVLPYAVLDTHDTTVYGVDKKNITNKVTDVPTVRISTDGEKLYFFIEVTGGDMLAVDQWNLLYLLVDYSEHGGDKFAFELFLSSLEGVYVSGDTTYATAPGGNPFRTFALNGSADNTSENIVRTNAVVANRIDGERRNMEISMPIPENMQALFTENGLDCGIGVYVRDVGNEGYTTPNLQLGWSGTTIETTSLPNVDLARPVFAGVQYKTYTSETNENKRLVDVRFAATLKDATLKAGTTDTCAFTEVGYDITYESQMASVNCYHVYEGLTTNAAPELPAEYGNGDFFFCYAIRELEVNQTYTFNVRAWTLKAGEVRVYTAETYRAAINIDVNGVAEISWEVLT